MIDINKTYRTRDGRAVRILATDLKGTNYPVLAVIANQAGVESAYTFSQRGNYGPDVQKHENDLVEVKPCIKRTVWLNVYPDCTLLVEVKENVDKYAYRDRIACVKVEIDVEEGEGL